MPAGETPAVSEVPTEVLELAAAEIGAASRTETFSYEEPDGTTTYIVLGMGGGVCGGVGAYCPAVVVRDGEVAGSFSVVGLAPWAPSDRLDAAGYRLIEASDGEKLSFIDPANWEPVEVMEGQVPLLADPQPATPTQ